MTSTHLLSAPYHHSPNVVRADFPDGQYIICGVPGGQPRLVMPGGLNVGTPVTWAPVCDSLADFRREVVDVWNGYDAYVDSLPGGQPQLMISQWRDSSRTNGGNDAGR